VLIFLELLFSLYTLVIRLQKEPAWLGRKPHYGLQTIAKCLIYFTLLAGFMAQYRLGDVIDDHCIKCRRITNHAIVSLVDGQAAKVRCRTCYHDHDYRHEQAPPSKKELKKMSAAEIGRAS
jgi:hypothetical protein